MYKDKIKDSLHKNFVSESETPGISVTKRSKEQSDKINKEAVKKVAKDSLDYNKSLKQDIDASKMGTNKYNYTNDSEKTYHDEMEILNGQEMIKYASEPGKEFSQKAKEGIEGSSRMGNEGKIGNAEATWGASSDDFGKKLVDRIKGSERKRAIADAPIDSLTSLGDKIAYPNDSITVTPDKTAMSAGTGKNNKNDKTPAVKSASENKNKNLKEIKESMKRLKFKKEFNGVGNALKLIPESYKVDKKEFEITDGNEFYKIRWEGSVNEGKAIILTAKDKNLVNEDIIKMKQLFNYRSESTLGLVKGNARLDENAKFNDIWKKTKSLLNESEDIEDENANEGDLDKVVKSAPEAKKDIEGSVSTDKGTKAPKPKEGDLDKVVKQAPEAKKHVHLKENDTKMMEDEDEEEEEKTDDFYKSDEDSEDEKEPTISDIKKDAKLPSDNEDDDDDIKVPNTSKEQPKLMKSTSTGKYFLVLNNKQVEVPEHLLSLAKGKNKMLALTKIEDEKELETQDIELNEGSDEYRTPEQFESIVENCLNGNWKDAAKQCVEFGFFANDLIKMDKEYNLFDDKYDIAELAELAQQVRK